MTQTNKLSSRWFKGQQNAFWEKYNNAEQKSCAEVTWLWFSPMQSAAFRGLRSTATLIREINGVVAPLGIRSGLEQPKCDCYHSHLYPCTYWSGWNQRTSRLKLYTLWKSLQKQQLWMLKHVQIKENGTESWNNIWLLDICMEMTSCSTGVNVSQVLLSDWQSQLSTLLFSSQRFYMENSDGKKTTKTPSFCKIFSIHSLKPVQFCFHFSLCSL